MGRRLTDNLNSDYVNAANRLRPKGARKKVVAYVESFDDVCFWRSILQDYETHDVKFEVMLPSKSNLAKGKKNAMMNTLGPRLGECMIACVDADYDYLMQGVTQSSRELIRNPYVFHTYVYAIENYQCIAESLRQACTMATLNDREVLDLAAFIHEYSRIIYPLFVWSIWAYRYSVYDDFTIMDFCQTVTFRDFNPYHPERTLEMVRRRVNRKQAWMQNRFPEGRKTYAPLKDELRKLGVTPESAYLYMQGHCLFDGVVMSVLIPICTMLRKEREGEIRRLACHDKQLQNELSSYQHSQSAVELMLRRSVSFKDCEPFARLDADLRKFVDNL